MGAARQLFRVSVLGFFAFNGGSHGVEVLALRAALSSVQQLYLFKVWMRSDFQELILIIISKFYQLKAL